MSKVDAQRAMREARYAALEAAAKAKSAPSRPAAPRVSAAPRPTARPAVVAPATAPGPTADSPASDGLCGHRNMGGRSCTREADHQRAGTKNHRYS